MAENLGNPRLKRRPYAGYAITITALLGVLVIWVVNGLVLYYLPNKSSIGDIFGISGSLFSGLALVGVFVAVFLQRDELRETKRYLRAERFEGTYFKLFDTHRKFVDEVRLLHEGKTYKGQDAMRKAYELFKRELAGGDSYVDEAKVADMFGKFIHDRNSIQRILGPYVRSTQNLLSLIAAHYEISDYSEIAEKYPEARAYRNLFRDYLSESEECLLYYNQVYRNSLPTSEPREDFISIFHVLRNLNREALAAPEHMEFSVKSNS